MTGTLPSWPPRTIAILTTLSGPPDHGPHAIPVSAPVRADDHTVLLALHRTRGSLARLRERPHVALTVLAENDIAFTVRGTARVVDEPMAADPDYVSVAITATDIDDHRQPGFVVEAGIDRRWIDTEQRDALAARVRALTTATSA
ncbi:pyridoxamine 5'-phosphate oxidase family protein [Actinomadura formosensis]|uniref:pyridoxamine 5'-phosphate oxidase family protein n=1 Tax=Actinomadura formosensis TaxID=60706 RepID=UPI00082BF71B|nr:pyridoxamine 5'-phosphate oxidase family protein [Actinomadura formosensis]